MATATPTAPVIADAAKLPLWALHLVGGKPVVDHNNTGGADVVATARYNESSTVIGWNYLQVTAAPLLVRPEKTRATAYYWAGYLEGHLTQAAMARNGFVHQSLNLSACAGAWMATHLAHIEAMVAAGADDAYWRQVGCLLEQMRGLADGYRAVPGASPMTFHDVFYQNFGVEFGNVFGICGMQSGTPAAAHGRMPPGALLTDERDSHCSGLVRVTADDLFVAHDTWGSFEQYGLADRVFKVYDFQATVTMSGYLGSISSGDDWYMTSHQLAVQETTSGVYGDSLNKFVVPVSVSEFLRVMVATYLAADGETWTTLFARENSGTYNNQYMVVDFKRYSPGASLVPGTLWVAEQIPGLVHRADVTAVLSAQGYWASYNIPYFADVYALSGFAALEQQQGSFWSHAKYARAEIFARDAPNVGTLAAMQRIMRYNEYASDPFSRIPNCSGAVRNQCDPKTSAMLSVASRGDLMPTYATAAATTAHYGVLGYNVAGQCFGAVDSKVASWKHRHNLTALAICGPTNDAQPTFAWGGGCKRPPTASARYDFPWVMFDIVRG
jgi:hypothetical protein